MMRFPALPLDGTFMLAAISPEMLVLATPLLFLALHYFAGFFRHGRQILFAGFCAAATWGCALVLVGLLVAILYQGAHWLDWQFLTSMPSRFPEKAGIWVPLVGSLWLMGLTALFAVPLGIGAALYLQEFAKPTLARRLIEINISNLAGVPSIVYGILGLAVFVRGLQVGDYILGLRLGRSVLAGSLTLTLVVLPIVILAAQEALRAVPDSIRHASFGLGATRWQTVWHQVLPAALPGISTGIILALSRAVGEAAPLVAAGAYLYVSAAPAGLSDPYSALPIQIFDWTSRPKDEFRELAAAGIIVLLAVLLAVNLVAVMVRQRFQKNVRW